jgi:hypothetical protein
MSLKDEFTMGHYQIFREFQSLANALLETVISDLGGSLEQFVKAADDVLARGMYQNTFSLYAFAFVTLFLPLRHHSVTS